MAQDQEATQLIPLTEIAAAAAEHNETDGYEEEPTVAYPIAPTTKSPSHSSMSDDDDDDDIGATIPYDMTQGVNLLTKGGGSGENSPDIENTIPYEMTQGVVDIKSPTARHSPVVDVEPTVPYEMCDASPTGCNPTVGVAEPAGNVDEPTVGVAEDKEEPTVDVDKPTVGVAEPTANIDEPTVGMAEDEDEPTENVDEPTVGMAEDEPTENVDEPAVDVAESTADKDKTVDEPTVDVAEPTVGVADTTVDATNSTTGVRHPTADDLDETQSIDNNDPTMAVNDPVGVADAMDDDATQTIDIDPTVGVAEMDTGDANTADNQLAESYDQNTVDHCNSPDHIPPVVSPAHSPAKTIPVHKTTPILKDVTSPKSPTPKKVHFESSKPPTLILSIPKPSGGGATVSVDDEESPDIEVSLIITIYTTGQCACIIKNQLTVCVKSLQ